ncbi:hypothetical protein CVT26_013409 [Gymnopilus dilepis]|uniref:Uncharacterized protein n=1 Tax=Gymnopilus dilepis TaxID=231916 RepID=A0A409VV59_9AGAR|nr:hypothetical protein CVT26_013409 [Gymnopilus dilepis]
MSPRPTTTPDTLSVTVLAVIGHGSDINSPLQSTTARALNPATTVSVPYYKVLSTIPQLPSRLPNTEGPLSSQTSVVMMQ